MWYCSVNCQRDDWREYHKHECQIFDVMKTKLEISTTVQSLVRMCIKYQYSNSISQRTWSLYDGRQRSIADLSSRVPDTLNTLVVAITATLNVFGIIVDNSTVKHRLGQLMVNSFGITNDLWFLKQKDSIIAGGLYIELSVFDNSCRPNAICVFNGPVMTVRALRDIDTEKERITVSYQEGCLMMPRAIRKEQLRKFGHFDCQCNVCMDPNYSDEAYVEFRAHFESLSKAIAEHNISDARKLFRKVFHLIQIVHGRYNKTWIEVMLLYMGFICEEIRRQKQPPLSDICTIENVIEYNEFQSYLRKTHGIEHPLYKVCLKFGEIICPPNTLHITGNSENPDFIRY